MSFFTILMHKNQFIEDHNILSHPVCEFKVILAKTVRVFIRYEKFRTKELQEIMSHAVRFSVFILKFIDVF